MLVDISLWQWRILTALGYKKLAQIVSWNDKLWRVAGMVRLFVRFVLCIKKHQIIQTDHVPAVPGELYVTVPAPVSSATLLRLIFI